MVYTYDNSTDNLHNPNNPPRAVHFGEQTKDEMALCGLEVVADNASEEPTLKQALGFHLVSNFFGARQASATSVVPPPDVLASEGLPSLPLVTRIARS